MISLVKNLKFISRLFIHYYPNCWYKSYITSLKAIIVGKSLISAGLDIDRILHFVFYDKILQIYRQTTLGQEMLQTHFIKIPTNFKNVGGGWGCGWRVVIPPPPHAHPLDTSLPQLIFGALRLSHSIIGMCQYAFFKSRT